MWKTNLFKKMKILQIVIFCFQALQFDNDENRKIRISSKVNNSSILFYHRSCYKTYEKNRMREINDLASERVLWVQNKKEEAFLKLCYFIEEHIDKQKEVFTLCDILFQYEEFQRDMDIYTNEIRDSSDNRCEIKSLRAKLQLHFGDEIGFHLRYRRNESSIVYFKKHGGAYVESALNCSNVTSSLIANMSTNLHNLHKDSDAIPWPSEVLNLKENSVPNDVHNLVAFLANPEFKMVDGRAVVSKSIEPSVRFISEALMGLITKKRQPMLVGLSIGIHNITGSYFLMFKKSN